MAMLRSFCDSYFACDGAQNERCGTGTWFVKRRKHMAAPQKKAASLNSSRGTNDRNSDKGEVGGSSPPRPTMSQKNLPCRVAATRRIVLPRRKSVSQRKSCLNRSDHETLPDQVIGLNGAIRLLLGYSSPNHL